MPFRFFGSSPTSPAFSNVQGDFGTTATADSNPDTLTLTSSDGSVTITSDSASDSVDFKVNTTVSAEFVRDTIGAALVEGHGIDITVNDPGDTITIDVDESELTASLITGFTEAAQDAVGAALTDTATIDFTYNDGANTITADLKNTTVTAASYGSASQVGTFTVDAQGRLTAAANVSIAITSSAVTDFTEAAQDAVGAALTDSATIDFTYNDAGNTITAIVIDASITNAKLANMATQTFKGRTTAGTGDPEDLTVTQATAMLNVMTGGGGTGLKGLAPAQVAGDVTKFLKGNATWSAVDLSTANVTGILPMANGGTNKNMTASAGAVAYSDSDSLELNTPSTVAGQVLQGNTTGAPTFSTATYPSTGGTLGTILRSNGTNWVNTTATYPTTTTANRILYSSATNTISEITSAATSALVTNSSSVPAFTSGAVPNRLLRTDGTTITFAQVTLTTDVVGILPIANGGTNNSTAYTAGSVIFSDGSKLTQDNANLFWDDANNVLGIGTASPNTSSKIHVNGQSYLDGTVLINPSAGSATIQIFDTGGLPYFLGTPGTQSVNIGDGVYAIGAHLGVSSTIMPGAETKQVLQFLKGVTNPAAAVTTTDYQFTHTVALSSTTRTDSSNFTTTSGNWSTSGTGILTASGSLHKYAIQDINSGTAMVTTNLRYLYAARTKDFGAEVDEWDVNIVGITRNRYCGVQAVTLGIAAPDSVVVAFGANQASPDTNYSVQLTGGWSAYTVINNLFAVVGTGWVYTKACIDQSSKATSGFTGYVEYQVVDGTTFREWSVWNNRTTMTSPVGTDTIITHYAGGKTVTFSDTDYLSVDWLVRRYF